MLDQHTEYRYLYDGKEIRVVVAGDVLVLPFERWSMGGFGPSITVEWLLHEAKLPGTAARKRALADCLVRSLRAHHEGGATTGDGAAMPRGPFVRCPTCVNSGVTGFVRSAP